LDQGTDPDLSEIAGARGNLPELNCPNQATRMRQGYRNATGSFGSWGQYGPSVIGTAV